MRRTSCEIAVKTRPVLVVLSGPSGAGKDAVLGELNETPFQRVVTVTTRPPRPDESDGVHYHFVSTDEFQRMRSREELLESAQVYGNWYGVPRQTVERALQSGQDVMVKVDVQGAATIKRLLPQAVLIYIAAPSMEELADRLKGRSTESVADMALRLRVADEELKQIALFDYLVVNKPGALDEAVMDIRSIINAEKCRIAPGALCRPDQA